jgi:hypothetical protein
LSKPSTKRNLNNMSPISKSPANVIQFPSQYRRVTDFERLTAALVVDQYRRGVLPEAVVVALLAGVGLELPQ